METFCAAPLYRSVENGLEISTRSCSQVLYDIGTCDASYLYLNERFLYTFACPIEQGSSVREKEERRSTETFNNNNPTTTTTMPPTTTHFAEENTSKSSFSLRGALNHSNTTTPINNTAKKRKNDSSVFVYSVTEKSIKDTADSSEKVPQAFIVTVIIFAIVMSVLSCAVLLYLRRKKNKKEKKMQRRPSSIMPDVVRSVRPPPSITREVKAVLNKMIKTICRWNGEEPYKQRDTAPPIPPRPPRAPEAAGTKRQETLNYLRRGTPHAAIQKALEKPTEDFQYSGQRRAELLRREAALVARRQESRSSRRNGRSRLAKIVRLREIHKKRNITSDSKETQDTASALDGAP